MELKTERLTLRDFIESDAEDIVKNANNLNVSRYLLLVAHPYTEENARGFIKHCMEEANQNPRESYELGIEYEGKIVGAIGLTSIDEFQETASFGYWLGEDYWRNGITSEAAREMLRFAFEDLGLRRINVEVFVENEASENLLKKLGFNFEGTRRQFEKAKSTGKIHDTNIYGLLREEWEK